MMWVMLCGIVLVWGGAIIGASLGSFCDGSLKMRWAIPLCILGSAVFWSAFVLGHYLIPISELP
jgi:hypothetical protein